MPIAENQVQQTEENGGARYILITQCLQNDFFLNKEFKKMLVGKDVPEPKVNRGSSRLQLGHDFPDKGPLGIFLEAVIDQRRREKNDRGILHVINIRDWHTPGAAYDGERRKYGAHCEEGTWGADYIEGLGKYLDPARDKKSTPSSAECQFFKEGSVQIYHVHSDSVFDFRPRFGGDSSCRPVLAIRHSQLSRFGYAYCQPDSGAPSRRA